MASLIDHKKADETSCQEQSKTEAVGGTASPFRQVESADHCSRSLLLRKYSTLTIVTTIVNFERTKPELRIGESVFSKVGTSSQNEMTMMRQTCGTSWQFFVDVYNFLLAKCECVRIDGNTIKISLLKLPEISTYWGIAFA